MNTERRGKRRLRLLTQILAAIAVFVTTYMLILPAITLDDDTAATDPGIQLVEQTESVPVYVPEEPAPIQTQPEDSQSPGEPSPDPEPAPAETREESPAEAAPGETDSPAPTRPAEESIAPAEPAPTEPVTQQSAEVKLSPAPPLQKADYSADLENAANWERSFEDVDWTGCWSKDLLLAARSQLGYRESSRNFVVDIRSRVLGYTRYGAWYGLPYSDWCAMFVSFCLHYAQVPAESFPREASCQRWIAELEKLHRYLPADQGRPKAGDLVFFGTDGVADHVGIVTGADEKEGLETIEGNYDNRVAECAYHWDDPKLLGYGLLPENPAPFGMRLQSETKHYEVTLHYGSDAGIPEDAVLRVREYKEQSEIYRKARETYLAGKEAEGLSVEESELGFSALDVSIRDAEGRELEPKAPVRVSITMRRLPEDRSAQELLESLEVQHLQKQDKEYTIREILNAESDEKAGSLETRDDLPVATIQVKGLSPFVITWNISSSVSLTVNLRYFDLEGNDISALVPGSVQQTITQLNDDNRWTYLRGEDYARAVEGYSFRDVKYNNVSVDWMLLEQGGNYFNRTYTAYFYHYGGGSDTERDSVNVNGRTTVNIDYFYERTEPELPTREVSLLFRYQDENGELLQKTVSLTAAVEGQTLNLMESPYFESFPGKEFSNLLCGENSGFDSIVVKMILQDGEYLPVCGFLTNGVESANGYVFEEGEPLEILFQYTTVRQPVVLRLLYADENGVMQWQNVTLSVTTDGTELNLMDEAYLKSFDRKSFSNLSCGELSGFDRVRLKLVEDNGTLIPSCEFITDGQTGEQGYTLNNGVLEINYNYATDAMQEQPVVLRLHYLDEAGEFQQQDVSITATEAGTELDLTDPAYKKSFEGKTFSALRCSDYNNFDRIRAVMVNNNGSIVPVCFFHSPDGWSNDAYIFTDNELDFQYSYTSDVPPQQAALRLHYVDENGTELAEVLELPVSATQTGIEINLMDSSYCRQIQGYSFQKLVCYQKEDFDSARVWLSTDPDGSSLVPSCLFLKNGEPIDGGYYFDGEPMDIKYVYQAAEADPEDNEVTLAIHYRNEEGEMRLERFTVEATPEGTRIFLKNEPYMKVFTDLEYSYAKCYDFQNFDTIELVMEDGKPVCYFLRNGSYVTLEDGRGGYTVSSGQVDLELRYVAANDWLDINFHHLYYNTQNGDTEALGDNSHVSLQIESEEGKTISVASYVLQNLQGVKFAGASCILNNGERVAHFDSVKVVRDETGQKKYLLYNAENYVGSSYVLGALDIDLYYVDISDDSGEWTGGGGTRPGGGTTPLPEPDLGELGDAQGSKTLEPNGDGTYTLTLSMVVPMIEAQASNKVNVVIIYDSSNSMHLPVPGNEWTRDDQHGTYAEYNGKYYQLTSIGSDIRKVFRFEDEDGVVHILGSDQPNQGIYCGPKYTPSWTRMHEAKKQVKTLVQRLLAMNTESNPDAVEIGFVEFASDIFQVQQPSTDLGTVYGWVDACKTRIELTQNGADTLGGTNWDAALKTARGVAFEGHSNTVTFSDDDPKYILFVSDGNPTARTTPDGLMEGNDASDSNAQYDDGPRIGSGGLLGSVIPGVYGTGNSDTQQYNINRAEEQAAAIVDQDGDTLYNIGIYGDADKMSSLSNSHYYDGTDASHMAQAFNDIIVNISSRLGYSNLSMVDGITSMTSSTLVHGDPRDFTYKVVDKDGNDVTDQVLPPAKRNARYEESPNDPNEAGSVTWELGADELLLNGGTYSLSFVVWPNQEAYDLVANLNNGMRAFGALTDVEKAQVVGSGPNGDQAPFSLRTNTRQYISYCAAKEVVHSDGSKTITYGDPQLAELETPDPMPLVDTCVKVQKEWNVSLDPQELETFLAEHPGFQVNLDLMKEGQPYVSDIVIQPTEGTVWPDTNHPEGYHISEGLMVSAQAAAEHNIPVLDPQGNSYYPTTTLNGKTYYILETGRDYYFREDSINDVHFELEDRVFHPMLVDGVRMDVSFGENHEIMQAVPFEETISAVNSLRGGVTLRKYIVDQQGNIIDDDSGSTFYIRGAITQNDEPLAGLEYRYYYDSGGRSEKYTLENSANICVELHTGETIRFVNVPAGCRYFFFEDQDRNKSYEFYSIDGNFFTRDEAGNEVYVEGRDFAISADGTTASGTTMSNTAQNIEVKNLRKQVSLEITKTNMNGEKLLPEAKFALFQDADCQVPAADAQGNPVPEAVTGSSGKLVFENLLPGDYYLKELEAPQGYILPEEPILIHIDNDGLVYTVNGKPGDYTERSEEGENGSVEVYGITVQNSNGYNLPHTGGPGLSPLYLAGLLLMGAAAVFYGCKLRRKVKGGQS